MVDKPSLFSLQLPPVEGVRQVVSQIHALIRALMGVQGFRILLDASGSFACLASAVFESLHDDYPGVSLFTTPIRAWQAAEASTLFYNAISIGNLICK